MNPTLGFRARFSTAESAGATLRIAASTRYRAFLNGEFVAWGPTRGPHDFYRVDVWDLSERLQEGENYLAIEVAGYNVNSFDVLDQPAFLQAEVVRGDTVLAHTDGAGAFAAAVIDERVQKCQRYSFQRAFSEVWRLAPGFDTWRAGASEDFPPVALAVQDEKKFLPHHAPLPEFRLLMPIAFVARGTSSWGSLPDRVWKDRSLTGVGPEFKGFPESELEVTPSVELQRLVTETRETDDGAYNPEEPFSLAPNEWRILDFDANRTGFVALRVRCGTPTTLYLTFDEILTEGDVDFRRLDCVNIVQYDLEAGVYEIETFEPYTLRYLKFFATGGGCEIDGVSLRELACPDADGAEFRCSDSTLERIFEAARETYRQNALDVFMDCPSRERAGWLCDSFFTARTAVDLSGHTRIEDNFFENYLLPTSFPFLPNGMLPMCYPSDHNDGNFIPNWALWFVVQLEEYRERGGDPARIAALEPRVRALFDYFAPFENADGLLEKLEKWVFVEWSAANDFVQDVNYPSNMLYAGALDAAARLFERPALAAKAERVRCAIREQSFDGEFFADNAVRGEDGALEVTRHRTETCQYYAFFFGIASADTHANLWATLRDHFGPDRAQTGRYADIPPAAAFIGQYLRLELLSRYGEPAAILRSIKGYFSHMAFLTGTLWEHAGAEASCNHGFASHVAHVLLRDVLGVRLDRRARTVQASAPLVPLEWCEGRVPVGGDGVRCRWKRGEAAGPDDLAIPDGYRRG